MNCSVTVCAFFLLTVGLNNIVTSVGNPCVSSTTLNSLSQRLTGYTLSGDETPLCDYYMDEGWYNLGTGNVLASSDDRCGTVYNWYLLGTLPDDNNVKQMLVCRNDGAGNNCSESKTIEVMKCGKDEYVFDLLAPDGCPEAYCIESLHGTGGGDTPPDISTVNPVIAAKVVRLAAKVVRPEEINYLYFFCDFTPPTGTDFFYIVEWGITTGLSWTHTLKTFDPVTYVSQFDFRNKTALTERMLEDAKFGHLGITIACSVAARKTIIGTSSKARESKPKFVGVEVQNKTIRVSNHDDTTIFLRLTVPFGCAIVQNETCDFDINVFIPKKEESCKIPELSTISNIRNQCGIKVRNDQINEWIPLRLSAFDGENRVKIQTKYDLVLSTQKNVPIHPFFSNYILDPIRVEVHTDMSLLKNKRCYSYNDPHMGSFDGLRYENQNSGKFILYRNTKYETQVQMQTSECRRNIWCNCGVVVNAGRDVFIANHCGRKSWEIRFRNCEDAILRRKVTRVHLKQYLVELPTGTKVTISIHGSLLNIAIAPGLGDYLTTEGLCGIFDGNIQNDRNKRPNSNENDPNKSWRVTAKEDLFNSQNDNGLQAWKDKTLLCTCNADKNTPIITDKVTCHPDLAKSCSNDRTTNKFVFEHQCSLKVRKKRNIHGMYVQRELDLHRTIETKFVSKRKAIVNQLFPSRFSKRMIYDDDTAKADCLKVFNTTVYSNCASLPAFDVNDFIENCILDAKISNSMDWSLLHLEALKDKCIHEVKVNQPFSRDELSDIEIIVNNTVINTETDSNNTAPLPDLPTFSSELLVALEEMTCPNECSGNGKCSEGVCICEGNFIGDDCSIEKSVSPIMEGIPDLGECDLQYRACNKTSVFATNLADTIDFTCQLVPFTVNSKGEIVKGNNPTMAKGIVYSLAEVSCPLEESRRKRSTLDEQNDYIAKGYSISVSNDGVEYSEEDILVIFDSECVECTKNEDDVTCIKKPGYCVKHGQCYRFGETYGCNACKGGLDNNLNWESGRDCPIPAPPPTETENLWIIAAVVCPAVVIVVVILGLFYYQSKRSIAMRKSMHSIEN